MQIVVMNQASQNTIDSKRLFLALWPETDVRAALQHWRDNWNWPSKSWLARPESLHLTLHFLGNIPGFRLPELAAGLHVPFNPFELTLSRTQVWSNGVAVLEPDALPIELVDLHAALGAALQQMAVPIETYPYRPHVTLARRAQGASPPANGAPAYWPVRSYALMESQQTPIRGYRLLQSYACCD